MVFGDSLSAGYGLKQGDGWVDLLKNRLTSENRPYRVVNASISGDTTSGGKTRLGDAVKNHRPAIVVIELGGNDGLRGLSLHEMKNNLEAMIRSLQKEKIKIILVGMELPPNYGPLYTNRFQQIYFDLAKQYRVPLVPSLVKGLEQRKDLFQADQIHPAADAQAVLLENVWPVLRNEL